MLMSTYLSLTIWLNFLISRLLSCIANSSSSYSNLLLLFILCTGTVCSCDCTLISLRELPISSYSFSYRFALDGNALSLMKLSFLESAISSLLFCHPYSHEVCFSMVTLIRFTFCFHILNQLLLRRLLLSPLPA